MDITRRILIIYVFLQLSWGCDQSNNYEHLNGEWYRIVDKYDTKDTVKIPNYFDQEVEIFTIKTDSGFSDHFYRNDSLILVDNSEKSNLMRISLLQGLITFQRKARINDTSQIVEFFANYEIKEVQDSAIVTYDGTFEYQMLNEYEIILNGNTYKREENSL